jgi:hypothetical protein
MQALTRFQDDTEVQDAVVAFLEKYGTAADFAAGQVARFAARAGIRSAVPVLIRLVGTIPRTADASRTPSAVGTT